MQNMITRTERPQAYMKIVTIHEVPLILVRGI
jgi:hypothetical protein